MKVYSASEYAKKLNVSPIWIRELCRKGRIYPARKVGRNWVLFENSTVIRPPERAGRKPEKMVLPHEDLSVSQTVKHLRYWVDHAP
jgi:hypothetical protein